MKQGKVLGVILSILNVVLIVICIFFWVKTDRTAPKIEFKASDFIYVSGMDEAGLLEGVTAYDNNDGDITDRIIIEKMIGNEEDSTLIVFYAVSDKAGNVVKASRVFPARVIRGNQEAVINEIKEAGIDAELNVGTATESDGEKAMESNEEQASIATPEPTPTPTPSPTPEPTAEPEQQTEVPRPVVVPEGVPEFTLKTTEVKTQRGKTFALVDVIGTLSDDTDSYETLFRKIQISEYDVNTAGRYQVTLVTEDSDGNQSQALPLTVIVE